MNFETETIEFKSKFTEGIYKEVIAFANTNGGIIYVGIDDDGKVVGLTDVDEEYTKITNGIRDAILPDVTISIQYSIQDNKVVKITVNEGTNKPYYLKEKGMKTNGVFVRQGTSSVPASIEQIRQMIKESDGDVFEEMRSLEQNLTFDSAKRLFFKCALDFSEEKYRTLGIVNTKDSTFTNLAKIVSDQCEHSVKIAVFSDEDCTVFRDSREFKGSVFNQFDECTNYLSLCNKTYSVIKGVNRIDNKDYPEEAIREALLNALVHRDYSFSGSIIINVTDFRMEFISIGGLYSGLSIDDIKSGISQSRNKGLAEIFHRLGLIESYGTGIRRIFNLYANCPIKPQIKVTENSFKIVLPNMNASNTSEKNEEKISEQMQTILDYTDSKGTITEDEIIKLLGVKKTRVYEITKQMCNMKILKVIGRGKTKYYTR